jgi:hypothetical protein
VAAAVVTREGRSLLLVFAFTCTVAELHQQMRGGGQVGYFFLKIVNNTQFIVHLVLIFVSQLIVGAGTCRCDPEDAPMRTDGRRRPQGNDGIGPRRMCS